MKTIEIKGKEYITVNERLKYFRETYKDYSLDTEIIQLDNEVCVLKAIVRNEKGVLIASGIAREINGDTFINKTSFVENCETSAWGRALGNLGIGIDTSVASADEVVNAITNQETKNKLDLLVNFIDLVNKTNTDVEKIYSTFNVKNNTEMSMEQLKQAIDIMKKKIKE